MDIVIREAVADDADGLAHVIVTATQTAFTDLVPEICLNGLTEDESAANWKRTLTQGLDPGEFLVVAHDESDVVVGYAFGEPCPDDPVYHGELKQLYVLPSCQRHGVGRVLVRDVMRRLSDQGIHSLRVGVLRVNPNRPFYERLGGQYLYERVFDWDGVLQPECVYGWKDTRPLLEG